MKYILIIALALAIVSGTTMEKRKRGGMGGKDIPKEILDGLEALHDHLQGLTREELALMAQQTVSENDGDKDGALSVHEAAVLLGQVLEI